MKDEIIEDVEVLCVRESFRNPIFLRIRHMPRLAVLLSLAISLTLLIFSVGVVSFERMGRYREKVLDQREFLSGFADERLTGIFNGYFWWSRMVEAVNAEEMSFIRAQFAEMKESHGVTEFVLMKAGEELFRSGQAQLSDSSMSGYLSDEGNMVIGKTFTLLDDVGQEYPDLKASVWVEIPDVPVQAEGSSRTLMVLSENSEEGAIPVLPGIWLVPPGISMVLRSLKEDRELLFVFFFQTAAVFLMGCAGLSLLFQRDWRTQRVASLAAILEEKDPHTRGHSDRVARIAEKIGREMGFRGKTLRRLKSAALTHDLGKIFVPLDIIGKPGCLSHREWRYMREHPVDSERIFLKLLPDDSVTARIIRSHHERWDGRGYPDGLAGAEIPLGARIIAVADAFDAMTSKRSYREALSVEQALNNMEENAGVQFDPEVVSKALNVLKDTCGGMDRSGSDGSSGSGRDKLTVEVPSSGV